MTHTIDLNIVSKADGKSHVHTPHESSRVRSKQKLARNLRRSLPMKRIGWALMLVLAASPAWAAKKLTVQQLKDLLVSLHQANKTDAEVAAELTEVELSEELSRSTMNSLAGSVSGQLTTEQLFILEARSAMLAPPAADLPATPAPDAATQKAILDKAADYASKTYKQLPKVIGTKATRRFQDNQQLAEGSTAAHSSTTVLAAMPPIRYMAGTETTVTSQDGVEQTPADKTQWGANGMIAMLGQGPVLSTVMQEAQAAGKINWVRWETVIDHNAAVYSFAVDKKISHYAVNYCCFPETTQGGEMTMRGTSQPGGPGNYNLNANWKNYRATVPYHGEIFVDPETGVVLRLITQADFKSSEWVRQEDQRIDYGTETVGGKTLVLPSRSIIDTLEMPYGDNPKGRFVFRHTLFTSEYTDYQAATN